MLKDIAIANRSYRGYDESFRFTRDDLVDLVDTARYGASSVNRQPFQYYIAWEKEEVEKIFALTKWARALPDMKLPHPGMAPTGFIIILHNTKRAENIQRFRQDVGIVAQTMLLAATEKGLGGCMIGNYKPEEVSALLELPEEQVPVLIIALGKPAEKIVITEAAEGDNLNYYRDGDDVHYVPKRRLEDVLVEKKK